MSIWDDRRGPGRGLYQGLVLAGLAAISTFALAPNFWWWLLPLTLPYAIFVLDEVHEQLEGRRKVRAAFMLGWWWGMGYFVAGLYWIPNALLVDVEKFLWLVPFAAVGIPAGLAIFTGLSFVTMMALWSKGQGRLLIFACIFVAFEWLRSWVLTGFPWNSLHQVWAGNATFMQLASITGPWGLSLIVAYMGVVPYALKDGLIHRKTWYPVVLAVILVGGTAIYGMLRLNAHPTRYHETVRVRIVQPNISQKDKWLPENAGPITDRLLSLSKPEGKASHTVVIWPEAATPYQLEHYPGTRLGMARRMGPGDLLVSGTPRAIRKLNTEPRYFNAVVMVDPEGRVLDFYHKHHLVPFGEYVPLENVLGRIGLRKITEGAAGFESGDGPVTVSIPGIPSFTPQICYEAIFPAETLADGQERPQWLINVTNDAWYGNTAGPQQHLAQARMRAVEQGLPLARSANNGVSALIDPVGRVLARREFNQTAFIELPLPKPVAETVYARQGSLWAALLFAAMLICGLVWPRKKPGEL